jgi:hypothetical protein
MSSSAPKDIQSIIAPTTVCIGMIHDLRRPMDGMKSESTTGDQSSLSE